VILHFFKITLLLLASVVSTHIITAGDLQNENIRDGKTIEKPKIFFEEQMPSSTLMLIFSLVGMCANSFCLWLLTQNRNSDINMRSVWLCARNDIIGNISVLITAGLVYIWNSRWPDIIVGTILATILLHSGYGIIRLAKNKLDLLNTKNN